MFMRLHPQSVVGVKTTTIISKVQTNVGSTIAPHSYNTFQEDVEHLYLRCGYLDLGK